MPARTQAPPSPPEPVSEILRYFLRHPRAADTLEGIVRWRLLEETVQRKTEETARALAWLVDAGLLHREAMPGGEPAYSLARERKAEAERLLARVRSDGSDEYRARRGA